MIKTAIATVVYPSAWKWRNDFLQCVNNTKGEFELVLINDGMSENEIRDFTADCKKKCIVEAVKSNSSISHCRIELLKLLKKNDYELAVFSDFDDTFSLDRVLEYQKAYISGKVFYYNHLRIMETGENYFDMLPTKVYGIQEVIESNFLGMGNTGLNISFLSDGFVESLDEVKTNVFDWYLFSRLLLDGFSGKFINKTYNNYRIGDFNIAGDIKCTIDDIKKEALIKYEHYKLLSKYSAEYHRLNEKYKQLIVDEKYDDYARKCRRNNWWWGCLNVLSEQ